MIRVAIIGAGIGAEHLQGYRALPQRFHVSTLCDLDLDRARAVAGAAADAGDIAVTSDFDAVLADPAIDLVDICLPPHLHVPMSLKALAAAKHVICEKPITRALSEVDQLIEAARQAGRQVFPVFQYRYGHAMAQLRALKSAGLLGRAYTASLETHWNRDAAYYAIPWRGTWDGEAGGAVLGHAIHAHDLLCHLLGPVAQVFAMTDTRVNPIETEDCAALAFRMESGALATSSITLGAGNDTTRLRLCYEHLTAESGTAPYAPMQDNWRFVARLPARQDEIDAIVGEVPEGLGGFAGYLEAVADALAGAGGAEVTLQDDGRRSIELITAIYASSRSGRAVALPLGADTVFYQGWLPDPPAFSRLSGQ